MNINFIFCILYIYKYTFPVCLRVTIYKYVMIFIECVSYKMYMPDPVHVIFYCKTGTLRWTWTTKVHC